MTTDTLELTNRAPASDAPTGRDGIRYNQNHHLWNNNGTWFIHYTVYPTPVTKERVRRSLGTRDLAVARARRDSILAGFG